MTTPALCLILSLSYQNSPLLSLLAQQIGLASLPGHALDRAECHKEPDFSYTVGLHTPGSQRPELFISGLSLPTRVHWLLDLGFRIQGPPPLETRQRMARAQGVPVTALTFPPGGQTFLPGIRYLDLANSGLPACFGEVERQHYDAHFGQAIVFHGTHDFPVLQLVWPDTHGRFPFEANFESRFEGKQRLLFEPKPYLPLRDEA